MGNIRRAIANWFLKGALEKNRSRYTGISLYPQQYGRALSVGDNVESQIKAYRSWVYTCVKKNSDVFASGNLRLYVAKKPSKSKIIARTKTIDNKTKNWLAGKPGCRKMLRDAMDIEEVVDHPFYDLMANVNGFANQFDLMARTNIHLELSSGGAYWYIVKDDTGLPREIWLMPTERMRVVPDKEKFISGYVYLHGIEQVSFAEEDIIHFKFPSATSSYYSYSPLQAIADAYNINANMNVYEETVFKNMGALSGWFTTEEDLSDTEFERMMANVQNVYSGVRNAGKIGVSDKGLKYQELGFTPKDLGFLNGRRVTRQEIMSAFGTPEGMFTDDANRANADTADYTHKRDTIAPRHKLVEDKINEKLIPMYGDDSLFVSFDNMVPEDKEYMLKERTENLKAGLTTRNEERSAMGYEPIDGADQLLIPVGYIPIDRVNDQYTAASSEQLSIKMVGNNHESKAIEFGSDEHKAIWGEYVKVADAEEQKFVPAMVSYFNDQESDCIKELKRRYGDKGIVDKSAGDKPLFDPKEWTAILKKLGYKHVSSAMAANAKRELRRIGVSTSFDLNDPNVTKFIEKETMTFSTEVNATTIDKLKNTLNEGLEAGEGYAELAKRVQEVFKFSKKCRAKLIARTEVTAAANFGAEEAYRQSDVVEKKQWLAAVDERTREHHLAEHGNIVELNKTFPVTGMKYPGDPDGNVGERANCRCTMVPVIKKGE